MKRSVLRYWLLLFLPTLVIAVAAFRLLRYEQARIDGSFKSAQLDRARSAAQGLKQTVQAVEDTLLESLKGLAPETLSVTLPVWVNQNPLVRNVFIWSSNNGLHYPPPGQVATREERRFVSRYATLFDGHQPWLPVTKDHQGEGIATRADSSATPVEEKTGLGQRLSSQTGRENLLDLARSRVPSFPRSQTFEIDDCHLRRGMDALVYRQPIIHYRVGTSAGSRSDLGSGAGTDDTPFTPNHRFSPRNRAMRPCMS